MELTLNPEAHVAPRLSRAELLRELAVVLYEREKLSLGRAARLADMDKWAFNDLLARREIPMHYGMKELEQDLATMRSLAER
jgi:predicted HTH domain antitoxin